MSSTNSFLRKKDLKKIKKIRAARDSVLLFKRTTMLLLLNVNRTIGEICDPTLGLGCEATVHNLKRLYATQGLDAALYDKPRSGRPAKISDSDKQIVVATTCSKPPDGFSRWTLSLLEKKVQASEVISNMSAESIRLILRDHHLKPWREKMWCVPKLNGEYIQRMEDVLKIYERPHNPLEPVVCIDEKPVQLLDHKRAPVPQPINGPIKKVDYEYKRCGTANVFCVIEPKTGLHITKVTNRRTRIDFAEIMEEIEKSYPDANKIHLVLDNLNTHNEKSLIERFGNERGSQIWNRFEVHYTPKHASWLNQAEIEIGMYSKMCLGKNRISNIEELTRRTSSWNQYANTEKIKIHWKFTIEKARLKFKYSKLESVENVSHV